jgi:RNA polymerase sigma-70 factor (ECF subfamily)
MEIAFPVSILGSTPVSDSSGEPEGLECQLKAGDRESLATLFAQYHDRLRRLVGFRMDHRLFGRVDPDDVLQEAYLAASQRLHHYAAQTSAMSPFVWLRLIVLQTLTDVHRHHLEAQMRDADREVNVRDWRHSQATSLSMAAFLVGRMTSPSQVAARAEIFEQVKQSLAGMEPLDQEVLALRHFEELSNSEVAEVLGIEQKAASMRYFRALKRLKDVLSKLPGFSDG